MKISRKSSISYNEIEFKTIENAIIDACTPNAWSYEDRLGQLELENEKLRELVARLVEVIYYDEGRSKAENLKYILGYSYEVEE